MTVKDVITSLDEIIAELAGMRDYLCAYEVFGKEPDYVPKRTAKRVRVPYQSHVAIGHYECGACGETVEPCDKYCSACGARLEDE